MTQFATSWGSDSCALELTRICLVVIRLRSILCCDILLLPAGNLSITSIVGGGNARKHIIYIYINIYFEGSIKGASVLSLEMKQDNNGVSVFRIINDYLSVPQ